MSSRSTFILTGAGLQAIRSTVFSIPSGDSDPALKKSLLGTDIWSNFVFPAGTYETLEGDVIEFDEVVFDSVIMNVTQGKNIVTTQVQGRNGTVKEYIADGDFQISIGGVLIGSGANVYPESDLVNLIEILKAPVSLKVESEFLSFFDIDEIVVTGYNFPQANGSRNTQPFQITALSDDALELQDISGV